MSYSQQPLLALLAEGTAPGESTTPEHIETVISNVYLFPERVYKVYKHDNAYMNEHLRDLGSREGRFAFTQEDFVWNRALSPSIYETLTPVRVMDGMLVWDAPEHEAAELLMVMRRVDSSHVLFTELLGAQITAEDCHSIGMQFAEATNLVQTKAPEVSSYENMVNRVADMRTWLASVPADIPPDEAAHTFATLEKGLERTKEHLTHSCTDQVVVDGDFHSHNLLFSGRELTFMDTYPPKPTWKLGHQLVAPYRVAVDLWALSGERTLFDTFMEGYVSARREVQYDEQLHTLLMQYVLTIQTPYHYHLARGNPALRVPAERFHALLREHV